MKRLKIRRRQVTRQIEDRALIMKMLGYVVAQKVRHQPAQIPVSLPMLNFSHRLRQWRIQGDRVRTVIANGQKLSPNYILHTTLWRHSVMRLIDHDLLELEVIANLGSIPEE